jgi:polysaccharide chain length determinant protein (PEP-CTERM system associated)
VLTVDNAPQVLVDASQRPTGDVKTVEQARQHLQTLRLQYTDQHPDVIAARRQLAQLEADVAQNKGHGDGKGAGAVKGQIPNTVYDQLKLKLSDAETMIPSLERKLEQARAEQKRIEDLVRSAPDVVAKAQDLDRDYGLMKAAYEKLVERLQAAQIADSASTKTDQIQFRIVEPPEMPVMPAAPNRPLFYSLVLLAGLGAGLAVPLALVQLDRSVASLGQLRSFGIPVIGSVTFMVTEAVRRRTVRHAVVICASTFVILLTYGALLVSSVGRNFFGVF